MTAIDTKQTWLFVAHTVFHLHRLSVGVESWRCGDRNCKAGERAFIYKPLHGIFLHFEILELLKKAELFCDNFQMATAKIKVLNVFDPPISSKMLKSSPVVRNESFVRRNFQGKSFTLFSDETEKAILDLVGTPLID